MSRLLAIGLGAFVAASLAIYFFGDSGRFALDDLSRYEQSLSANVVVLQERNLELERELQRLKSDPDRIRVLARDVGLYEPGESVVMLVGRPPRAHSYAVGDLIRMRRPEAGRNAVIKEAALGATLAALVAGILAARAARRRGRGPLRG